MQLRRTLLNQIVAAGLWISLLGAASNWVVIISNNGMPVAGQHRTHGLHIPMTKDTCFNTLGDWISVPLFDRTASPGDFLIVAGMFIASVGLLYGGLKRCQ